MSSQLSIIFAGDRDSSRSSISLARADEPRSSSRDTSRPRTKRRRCEYCKRPLKARARRDAITCSKPCRQARHRATRRAEKLLAQHRGFEPRRLLSPAARSRTGLTKSEVAID